MFRDRAPQVAALTTILAMGVSACGSSQKPNQDPVPKGDVAIMEESMTGIVQLDADIALVGDQLTGSALTSEEARCHALVAKYNRAATQHGGGTIHLPASVPTGLPNFNCK